MWGGNTFQSSIYQRFSLKPGFVFFFFLNTRSLWISRLLIELRSSLKNKNNPHGLLIWGGDTFQNSIYHSFPLKTGCVKITPIPMTVSASNWATELIKKRNPHGQLICHSFPLKMGCVKNTPIPVTLLASNWEFASDIQRGSYQNFLVPSWPLSSLYQCIFCNLLP